MTLAGKTVFVLEDEFIIAFALEDMLQELGASVVMAGTVDEGFARLDDAAIALAILDVNVAGTKSYPLAEELTRRGVPLMFATGYGDAQHPPHFNAALTLTKPYTRQQLVSAIEALI